MRGVINSEAIATQNKITKKQRLALCNTIFWKYIENKLLIFLENINMKIRTNLIRFRLHYTKYIFFLP